MGKAAALLVGLACIVIPVESAGAHAPEEITVLVVDGSGIAGAGQATANVLLNLGYPIAGVMTAQPQDVRTVACRDDRDSGQIAAIVQGASVIAFPDALANKAEPPHCIVTLGRFDVFQDDHDGFSVSLPTGWMRTAATGASYPRRLIALVSEPPRQNNPFGCTFEEVSEPPGTGVLVQLSEYHKAYPTQERRKEFGPFSRAVGKPPAIPGCPSAPRVQTIIFREKHRSFVAHLVIGSRVPRTTLLAAYEMLNSFQFEPRNGLERPPIKTRVDTSLRVEGAQKIPVLVLNGSGIEGAATTTANQLRSLGYLITGIGNVPRQERSTVACRRGRNKYARNLAHVVGIPIQIVRFTESAETQNAICVVVIGS